MLYGVIILTLCIIIHVLFLKKNSSFRGVSCMLTKTFVVFLFILIDQIV